MTTSTIDADLRHAAVVIRDAVTGTRRVDAAALAAAHRVLTHRRSATRPAVRDAIDHYLNEDTWRQGPFVLRYAAIDVARQLGVAVPDPAEHVWVQPALFDIDHL